ncbi:MAG: cytochrome c [Gammaproteobacteria bacterium]|nr:cytochrome c [Gammaproteobacteria bacterium]MBU1723948.1 cytochrome c [Gammaproteobacteria bacterium]MBU2007141.1 cytochrome c [Gammaproteobacteria bacterium]
MKAAKLGAMFLALWLAATLSHADGGITLKQPPESLAQWYKPANKRNVWQHNMFSLRRETQAVEEYLEAGDTARAGKWAAELSAHYRKIAEMVPEWEPELDLEAATRLEQASTDGKQPEMQQALDKLKETCKSCHTDYRAVSAALYRAPDFSELEILDEQGKQYSYHDFMQKLMHSMNRIKIAADDERFPEALDALADLETGIGQMGESCSGCHKEPEAQEYYLGKKSQALLENLRQSLQDRQPDKIGENLGAVAVHNCARCHGTHRIAYDLSQELQ